MIQGAPEATAVEIVLGIVLFKHYLLENLRERVATGVGGMLLRFGHGHGMRVKEMSHRRVTADQDELTEGVVCTAFLQEPEQTFDRNVHDLFRGFLAGGQVNHVGDAFHGFPNKFSVGNVSRNDFKPDLFFEKTVVAQGSHGSMRKPFLFKETLQKPGADLAGGACKEKLQGANLAQTSLVRGCPLSESVKGLRVGE